MAAARPPYEAAAANEHDRALGAGLDLVTATDRMAAADVSDRDAIAIEQGAR
jgi:hypothetical protein